MVEAKEGPADIAKASAHILWSTIVQGILWFFFLLIVARRGGPSVRGVLAFLTATPTLLHFLSALGLDAANLYFAGRERVTHKTIVATSIVSGVTSGSLFASLAWVIFQLAPGLVPAGVSTTEILTALAATPFMSVQLLLTAALVGSGHAKSATRVWVSIPTVSLILLGAVLGFGLSPSPSALTAIISWSLGHIFGAILACTLALRFIGVRGNGLLDTLKKLLKYGLPLHVGQIADLATFRVDTLILAALSSASQLGIYAAAVNVAEVMLYLPSAAAAALLSASGQRNHSSSYLLTVRVLAFVSAVSFVAALVGAFLAPLILLLLYGSEFAIAGTPLRILLAAMVGMSIRRVLWAGLAAQRRRLSTSTVSVIVACLVICLDLVLIPVYGAVGAAWASAIAYWTGAIIILILFLRKSGNSVSLRDGFRGLLWSDLRTLFALITHRGRKAHQHESVPPPT